MTPNRQTRPGRAAVTLLLALIAAACGAGGVVLYEKFMRPSRPADSGDPPPRATNDPIVALGRLKPAGGFVTISGPPGDQIDELSASLGAEFEVPDKAAFKERAKLATLASFTDRSAEVALLDQQLQDARQQREFALSGADLQIELAQQKLEELKTVTPLEIEALGAKIPPLEQQRDNARNRRQRAQELRAKNGDTVSQQELDDLNLLEKTSDAELKAAKTLVQKAEAARTQGLQAAALQLKTAQAGKLRAEKDASLQTIKAKLDLAELMRDRSILRAPPGKWRVIKVWAQRGEPTAPQQPILQLAATGPMIAVAEVYETDIQRLRAWQKAGGTTATIKSRALPQELAGTVAVIPDVILRNSIMDIDPAADVDRRVFEVQVALDAKSSEIAAGYLNLQVQVELKPGAARP